MKTFLAALAAATLTAGAALAMGHVSDTDGDGVFSIEELAAVFPGITDEIFAAVDTDGDGAVSAEELAAAEEAGVLTQG